LESTQSEFFNYFSAGDRAGAFGSALMKKTGFVLLEALAGFMILIIFLSAFLFALMNLNKSLMTAQKKHQQNQLIKNKIEMLKGLSYEQLKAYSAAPELTVKEIKPDLLEAVLTTLNEKWIFRLAR
jgi:type II secretory pathway pseudopilin PulG